MINFSRSAGSLPPKHWTCAKNSILKSFLMVFVTCLAFCIDLMKATCKTVKTVFVGNHQPCMEHKATSSIKRLFGCTSFSLSLTMFTSQLKVHLNFIDYCRSDFWGLLWYWPIPTAATFVSYGTSENNYCIAIFTQSLNPTKLLWIVKTFFLEWRV